MFIEIEELEKAFHIPEPWYIDHCKFNDELQQLDVFVKFRKRGLFSCSGCGFPSMQDIIFTNILDSFLLTTLFQTKV